MVQANSDLPDITPGQWRNTSSGEVYGPDIEVIPLAFKVMWVERQNVKPYATVGRYEPKSIEVQVTPVPSGQRGFPKMINPKTGFEVQELFVYAVMLKEHPESGVLYLSPTPSSMRGLKSWNRQLREQRITVNTGNGLETRPAPIFAYSWHLHLDMIPSTKSTSKITALTAVARGTLVAEGLFKDVVQPQLAATSNIGLLAAPESTGEAE
jgi:hypothetical protein